MPFVCACMPVMRIVPKLFVAKFTVAVANTFVVKSLFTPTKL